MITTLEAKRRILQSQPGKSYDYLNVPAEVINAEYAGYMAKNHPEIRFDAIDGYAQAWAADPANAR